MDEWEIKKDMNPPKNLERAVKADMKRIFKRFTGSSEFKGMSKKDQKKLLDALPAIVVSGYMMSVCISAFNEMMKSGKPSNRKARKRRK